jgi:hypothetical protein
MAKVVSFHGAVTRPHAEALPSNRSFGFVMTGALAAVGAWPLISGEAIYVWAVATAGVILVVALVWPAVLQPFNRLWMAFGRMLHMVVTPLIMAILFYGTVTPLSLLMRLARKIPIPLALDRTAESYWIERNPPGPAPDSMKNQF